MFLRHLEMKSQAIAEEKMFANHISEKDLYLEYKKNT